MAKNVTLENIAHARAFVEKFGFGEHNVTVDQFDVFIIDRGLAEDPQTSDVKSNSYKGFVQQRGAARRALNTAGVWINGSSFQVVVDKVKNRPYSVVAWAVDANETAKNITRQVDTFVKSRTANLKAAHRKAETLIGAGEADDDLHLTQQLLASMVGHGITMQAKIAGLLKQYDTAYAAVLESVSRVRIEGHQD